MYFKKTKFSMALINKNDWIFFNIIIIKCVVNYQKKVEQRMGLLLRNSKIQIMKKNPNCNLLDTTKLVIKIKCDWIQIP